MIELKPFQRNIAERLALLANNPKVSACLRDNFPSPYSLADAHYWIDMCSSGTNAAFQRAIYYNDEFVGGIGVMRQEDIYHNSAEIGYWLGEPYWGKGIATDAVKEMTSWVFVNTTIIRLYAGVFETNPASMRVLEKAGFEAEAIHRKAITKSGRVLDEHVYARVR